MQYGGIWRRATANAIDNAVLTPLGVVGLAGLAAPPEIAIPLIAFSLLLILAYEIVLTALLGRTLGKLVLGLRVVDLDAEPISWGRALLRSSPHIALTGLYLAMLSSVLLHEVVGARTHPYGVVFAARDAIWNYCLASMLWALADAIALLISRRRRALHDLIAGTVVVQSASVPLRASPAEAEEPRFKSPPLEASIWPEDPREPLMLAGPGRTFPCPECDAFVNFGVSECRECGERFHYEDGRAYRSEG